MPLFHLALSLPAQFPAAVSIRATIANSVGNLAFCLAAPHGLQHYLRTHYGDKTFEHLYRMNIFDTLLLIPYFTVMIVLASYGMHRYQLVYLYFKHREKATKEPPSRFA